MQIFTSSASEELIDSGGATPSIGSVLHMNSDGSYWIGASESDQQVLIPASNATDWINSADDYPSFNTRSISGRGYGF